MRRCLTALTGIVLSMLVTSCSLLGSPSTVQVTVTVAPSVPAGTPSGGPTSPSALPSLPSALPSATATPTPKPQVILRGSGIGSFKFATATEATVEAALKKALGNPARVSTGLFCEPITNGPYTRTLTWGALRVTFAAANNSASAPRKLTNWQIVDTTKPPKYVYLTGGMQWRPTFAQLLTLPHSGDTQWGGMAAVFLDNGLIYLGDDLTSSRPSRLMAGELLFCD